MISGEEKHIPLINNVPYLEQSEPYPNIKPVPSSKEEQFLNPKNPTISIISHHHTDHDYFTPKPAHQDIWYLQQNHHQEHKFNLHESSEISSSLIYPHPAPNPVYDYPCYDEQLQHASQPVVPLSPCPKSPESIADVTMTELTELSPAFSVEMENPYNQLIEHNLDILSDAFNTAVGDLSETEMFNIQPLRQENWNTFHPCSR